MLPLGAGGDDVNKTHAKDGEAWKAGDCEAVRDAGAPIVADQDDGSV